MNIPSESRPYIHAICDLVRFWFWVLPGPVFPSPHSSYQQSRTAKVRIYLFIYCAWTMKILTQTDLLGFRLAPPIFFWLSFTGAYYIGAVSIHFPLATIVVSDTVLVFFFFFFKNTAWVQAAVHIYWWSRKFSYSGFDCEHDCLLLVLGVRRRNWLSTCWFPRSRGSQYGDDLMRMGYQAKLTNFICFV